MPEFISKGGNWIPKETFTVSKQEKVKVTIVEEKKPEVKRTKSEVIKKALKSIKKKGK